MMSSRTFTLFAAPHSSSCRFSSLSVSGTKLATVRKVTSCVWAKAGALPAARMPPSPAAPPAAAPRKWRRLMRCGSGLIDALRLAMLLLLSFGRLLDGAGRQARDVVIQEEDVRHHDRQRADASSRHQPAPV